VENLGYACIEDIQQTRKYLHDKIHIENSMVPELVEALKEFDVKQAEVRYVVTIITNISRLQNLYP
jgi:uncharacterized tellurite resistance protein B-like protein